MWKCSAKSESIDPKALLGKKRHHRNRNPGRRQALHLDGIVTRFGMQGQDHRHYAYKARLSPWLWLATRKSDFRIFQNQTVPEHHRAGIGRLWPSPAKETHACLSQLGLLRSIQRKRLRRLCLAIDGARRAIYYFFEHASGQHTLVLCDDIIASHSVLPGGASIPFYPPEKAAAGDQENIHAWHLEAGNQIGPPLQRRLRLQETPGRPHPPAARARPRATPMTATKSTNGRAATPS